MANAYHPKFRGVLASLVLAGVLVFDGGSAVYAQPPEVPPGLLYHASEQGQGNARPVNRAAARARKAQVDSFALTDDSLLIELFDDVSFVAELERRRIKANGTEVWIGKVQGAPGSRVVLAERDGVLSGNVRLGGKLYEINYAGNGEHSIEEIDTDRLPAHVNPIVPAPDQLNDSFDEESASGSGTPPTANAGAVTIDVMVVYTASSRSTYGGTNGIETRIEAAVADANQANINSQVDIQFNLVHMGEVNYNESSGNMLNSLEELTAQGDGKAEEVHTWRDDYGADMVSMVTEDGGCGIAYLMQQPSSGFERWAFSVVSSGCLTNQTLAHEMGHNQGSEHNIEHAGFDPVYDYSYGHRVSGAWRTIMSYGNNCSCPSVDHFSNPNVVYNGEATGVNNSADNARSLNNTAAIVAGFRDGGSGGGGGEPPPPPEPPMAPEDLVASVVSDTSVTMSWTDNSDDETLFKIQRSDNNGSWFQVGSVGANVTTFSNGGLLPGTLYSYRVRATNNTGDSSWSNSDSVTTPNSIPYSDEVAQNDTPIAGTVSNTFVQTHGQEDAIQSITETKSPGSGATRYSYLEHEWVFDLVDADTFYVNAYRDSSSDGDNFVFAYSTNGSSYSEMVTVSGTHDDDSYQTFTLPSPVNGVVYVKVFDTDHTPGHVERDTIKVDHMYFRANGGGGGGGGGDPTPPTGPSGLSAEAVSTNRIDLTWNDQSNDELGFEIESSFDQVSWDLIGSVPANATSYNDTGLAAGTTYHYRVRAFNEAGDSPASEDTATTFNAGSIDLTASVTKPKKFFLVELLWSGASTANVDFYRNGKLVTTTVNDGVHNESRGKSRAGQTYTYKICNAGSSDCSNETTVTIQ